MAVKSRIVNSKECYRKKKVAPVAALGVREVRDIDSEIDAALGGVVSTALGRPLNYSPAAYFSEEGLEEALRALAWTAKEPLKILAEIARDSTIPAAERRYALRDFDARLKEVLIMCGKLRALDQKFTQDDAGAAMTATTRTIQLLNYSTHSTMAALGRAGLSAPGQLPCPSPDDPRFSQEITNDVQAPSQNTPREGGNPNLRTGDQPQRSGPVRHRDSTEPGVRSDRSTTREAGPPGPSEGSQSEVATPQAGGALTSEEPPALRALSGVIIGGVGSVSAGVEEGETQAKAEANPPVRPRSSGKEGPPAHQPPTRGNTSGLCRPKKGWGTSPASK